MFTLTNNLIILYEKKALLGMLKSRTLVLKDYKSPNEVGDVDVKFTLHFLLVKSNRTNIGSRSNQVY